MTDKTPLYIGTPPAVMLQAEQVCNELGVDLPRAVDAFLRQAEIRKSFPLELWASGDFGRTT